MIFGLLKTFWFPLVIGGFIAALAIAGRTLWRKRDGSHDN